MSHELLNADVARLSGAPERAVRYWALSRVIEAEAESDRAGSGHHRQFSKHEVIIACIIQGLSLTGLHLGLLTKLSKTVREKILTDDASVRCLEGAIRGDFKVFMVVDDAGQITLHAPATDAELAGIFLRLADENPGFIAVFLNGCFSRLRSEWHERGSLCLTN